MISQIENGPTRVLLAVVKLGAGCSISEIVELTQIPRVTVHEHLVWLKRHRFVTWEPNKKRTLRPLVTLV